MHFYVYVCLCVLFLRTKLQITQTQIQHNIDLLAATAEEVKITITRSKFAAEQTISVNYFKIKQVLKHWFHIGSPYVNYFELQETLSVACRNTKSLWKKIQSYSKT